MGGGSWSRRQKEWFRGTSNAMSSCDVHGINWAVWAAFAMVLMEATTAAVSVTR